MKKINFSRIFDNNKFVKIFSVVAGILTWLVVVVAVDPNTVTVVSDVPVSIITQGTTAEGYGLSVIDGANQKIDVKVDGKRYKIGSLSASDFVATVSLNTVVKAGDYDLEITIKKRDEKEEDYSISSISSSSIKVTVDFVEEKKFEVEAIADKIQVEDGYLKETPYVTPGEILLKGPKSELDKIAKCAVVSTTDKKTSETLVEPGTLTFFDAQNNKLNLKYVTYNTQNFEITIPIYLHKTVPLKIDFLNVPQGFDVAKVAYTLSVAEIEIAGPKSIMDNIKEITIGQIDFRKIDIGSVFEFDVTLLAGIVNVNNVTKVTVDFQNQEFTSKYLNVTNVLTKNEPANYTIDLSTKTINNVKIIGKPEDIKGLTSGDVVAVVDLAEIDLTAGTARVAVKIHI
ncbi:MAG: hypothetical protein RR036_02445, partial [Oscillospiraceae bacterium]